MCGWWRSFMMCASRIVRASRISCLIFSFINSCSVLYPFPSTVWSFVFTTCRFTILMATYVWCFSKEENVGCFSYFTSSFVRWSEASLTLPLLPLPTVCRNSNRSAASIGVWQKDIVAYVKWKKEKKEKESDLFVIDIILFFFFSFLFDPRIEISRSFFFENKSASKYKLLLMKSY